MNDYSGSLALQTVGIRVRRPASALVVTALAFVLILWLHTGDTSSRFQDVLLVVGYWIPGLRRGTVTSTGGSAPGGGPPSTPPRSTPSAATPRRRPSRSSSRCRRVPFMNTSFFEGPVARAWHGADTAYFVDFLVAAMLYGCYRVWRHRAAAPAAAAGTATHIVR